MGVGEIVGGIFIILMSIFLIVIISMQESNSSGANALSGASSSDSYYGKNSGRTLEAMLKRITKISIVGFFAIVIILNFIMVFFKK